MEIKKMNSCESCLHNEVCMFKNEQREVLEKMNGHLDNYSSSPVFEVRFLCLKYSRNSLCRE